MSFDPEAGLRLQGPDADLPRRLAALRALGLGAEPDPQFDRFAAALAQDADAPYAMVNFITDRQFFAGLFASADQVATSSAVGRFMERDHGFCPEVLDRRKSLVLPDVFAAPRFASNPVVDQIGIRTYAGAPLIDEHSGIALGTVCVVGTEPRPLATGRDTLHLIKSRRDELMQLIYERAADLPR
ncbi:GAF domain-containing protein [Streptomyces sp. NPDC005706]|uniref:GAF domain-containing protein n=1 Tax=Streptomyces sp. NPDC005706 TaxID=3157169 RepID=UPI0033C500A8